MEFNSEGMFRASRVAGAEPVIEIYRSAAAAGAAAAAATAAAAAAGDHSAR